MLAAMFCAGPAFAQGAANPGSVIPATPPAVTPGARVPGATMPAPSMPVPNIPGLSIPGPNIPGSIFTGGGMPGSPSTGAASPGLSSSPDAPPGGIGQLYGGTGLPPVPGTALPFTCPAKDGGRALATSHVYDGSPLRGMPLPGVRGTWTLRPHNWPGNAYYIDCEYGLDRPPLGIRLPSHVRSCRPLPRLPRPRRRRGRSRPGHRRHRPTA